MLLFCPDAKQHDSLYYDYLLRHWFRSCPTRTSSLVSLQTARNQKGMAPKRFLLLSWNRFGAILFGQLLSVWNRSIYLFIYNGCSLSPDLEFVLLIDFGRIKVFYINIVVFFFKIRGISFEVQIKIKIFFVSLAVKKYVTE